MNKNSSWREVQVTKIKEYILKIITIKIER
jgi:hypothetical protein